MRHWPLIGLLLLVGCDKKPSRFLVFDGHQPDIAFTPLPGGVYIVMGQSNGERVYQYGFTKMLAQMQAKSVHDVSVINCARGGYPLSYLMPGTEGYTSCVNLVKQSGQPIAGIIFWQGETDANYGIPQIAQDWGMNFTHMIQSFRADINAPNVRVLYPRLNIQSQLPCAGLLRTSQESVFINNGDMIDIDDLIIVDGLHYASAGYEIATQRFIDHFQL